MDSDLTVAFNLHQSGRFADAARRYYSLLAREPDHAEALHLFGIMHHQAGHPARAVELIARAVDLRPKAAIFSSNLAESFRVLGRFDRAVESCETALRIVPEFPEALNTLGLALQATGRLDEAVGRFLEALRIRPDFAQARNNLGTALRELRRGDEALEAFRAAVESDPSLAEARANLGQALVDRGEAEAGLEHGREAVRLQPALAAGYNNLGNAYRALERWPEAQAAFAEAARLAPDVPLVHANRGLAWQGDGQFVQAVASFRRAVELAPEDLEICRSLANAHLDAEDHAAAISCFERLAASQPGLAQSHNELGWALQKDGRHAEAAEAYRQALDIQPGFRQALLNQGSLHEVLGEMAEAEGFYRRVLADWPGDPAALANLATLLRGRLPDPDREAVSARLDKPDLADGPHGDLLFAMAYVLDARGESGEAAACLNEANRLAASRRKSQGRRYDPREHSAFVDRLIEAFTPELFARLSDMGDSTRRPVFVFGMPRSGTTLVEQILASHPRVHGAGELRLARETFESIRDAVGLGRSLAATLGDLDPERIGTLARSYLDGVQAVVDRDCPGTDPDRVVDKMPDNLMYLGMISVLFPNATLMHVRRDPRDVALSCWMTNFASIRWADEPDNLIDRIRDSRRLADHWRAALPSRVHEVVYERLVDDFEAESKRLVAACGLDWDAACLDFQRTERPVRTASVTQVRQPLYRKAVARWKRYAPALGDLFRRLPVD
jgi:tetratricopeptide (TPR) repeat protein